MNGAEIVVQLVPPLIDLNTLGLREAVATVKAAQYHKPRWYLLLLPHHSFELQNQLEWDPM